MRRGGCTYQDCGKPSRFRLEQRLCADHLGHSEILFRYRQGLAEALKICRAVSRRMTAHDRLALRVASDEIRAKIRCAT